MSKIGKKIIDIPKDVKVELKGLSVLIEGTKGKFNYPLIQGITVKIEEQKVFVQRQADTQKLRAYHGLVRSLISNMIEGVSKGFKKELEIVGVGYKAQIEKDNLVLRLGFSHPVKVLIWKDLKVTCASANKITVEGIDKQRVGEFSAQIQKILPPEPYKGKGIRYANQQIRKKIGKAMAKG